MYCVVLPRTILRTRCNYLIHIVSLQQSLSPESLTCGHRVILTWVGGSGRMRQSWVSHDLGCHTLVAWKLLVPSESRTSFYEANSHIMRLAEVCLRPMNRMHRTWSTRMTCDQNISIADLIALRDNKVASDRPSQDLNIAPSLVVRLAKCVLIRD
jgi:hypothetical protein